MHNKKNPLVLPVTPIITGVLPVVFLASINIDQIDRHDITRSFFVCLGMGVAVLLVLRLIFRSWKAASILGSIYLLVFFTYGHAYQWLEARHSFLGHHSVLLTLFGGIAILVTWLVFRWKEKLSSILVPLNTVILVLFLYSAIPVAIRLIQYETILRNRANQPEVAQESTPDVYFIILDAYARKDVLEEKFGFDNSAFIDRLDQLGFTVLDCSQSNYQITLLSIMSTFSMDYFYVSSENLGKDFNNSNISIDRSKIIHNPVRDRLETLGYYTVSFESAYPWTETPDVDKYFKVDLSKQYSVINKFEEILINSSMAKLLMTLSYLNPTISIKTDPDLNTFDESAEFYYLVHKNTLDKLDTITSIKSPKYVYAHLGAPHEPYVLARDGSFAEGKKQTGDPYINQLVYINNRITRILETILRESQTPPIIVLESDHGYDPKDKNSRMKNFMAFYVPDEIRSKLYPTMTPVNSFRLVLNYLDGGTRPLLPDYSFYSPEVGVQDFEVITGQCPSK